MTEDEINDLIDEINDLIDECIDHLADESTLVGAQSLQELARIWAKAGVCQSSFMDIRKFIIDQAVKRTDVYFINEKLRISEQQLQRERSYVRAH